MDRNQSPIPLDPVDIVALRKESVDRNVAAHVAVVPLKQSLSARRAWIEMEYTLYCPPFGEVALRKESVDRNSGTWTLKQIPSVALRKESVDRNTKSARPSHAGNCRSPQGERG